MIGTDDGVRRALVYALIFVVGLLVVWECYALLHAWIMRKFYSGTQSIEAGVLICRSL